MEWVLLGKTGIRVSRICFGCWQAAGWASSDDKKFVETLRYAVDTGINFVDTAVAYGNGHSEKLVGKALKGIREKVVIASKFRPKKSRPSDLRKELEGSLKRLKTDYIDLYQQHWPSADVPLSETIAELEKLKDEGKIRAIGVSNWMEPEWEEIKNPERIDCLQPNYSLLWRVIERNVLPLCIRYNIAVITYSTLCQGLLTGRFKTVDDIPGDCRSQNYWAKPERFHKILPLLNKLEDVARKYNKTIAQVAIRWVLDRKGITSAIVGASSCQQLKENLGALDWKLEFEDVKILDELSLPFSEGLHSYDTLWGWHPKRKQMKDLISENYNNDNDLISKLSRPPLPKINPGKWQLYRERCQIPDPLPERVYKSDCKDMKDLMFQVISAIERHIKNEDKNKVNDWEKLVGKPVSLHSRPGMIKKDMMIIYVDSSVWLQELSQYFYDEILQAVREKFPHIKKLIFKLDPEDKKRLEY